MLALSLIQPWAHLIVEGHKTIETRSWKTTFRGDFIIHASKRMDPAIELLCNRDSHFYENLTPHTWSSLPRGMALCIVELYDVIPTEELIKTLSTKEMRFGDYRPGRYGYLLRNVRKMVPTPLRGKQSFFEVPHDWNFLRASNET